MRGLGGTYERRNGELPFPQSKKNGIRSMLIWMSSIFLALILAAIERQQQVVSVYLSGTSRMSSFISKKQTSCWSRKSKSILSRNKSCFKSGILWMLWQTNVRILEIYRPTHTDGDYLTRWHDGWCCQKQTNSLLSSSTGRKREPTTTCTCLSKTNSTIDGATWLLLPISTSWFNSNILKCVVGPAILYTFRVASRIYWSRF